MTDGDGETTEAVACMACGRLLRDRESRRLRIGPACLRRLQAALKPPPRLVGTRTAVTHPQAVPARWTAQLEFEIWDDDEDQDEHPLRPRRIVDVPTGALL
ncbi:DUF6011 domain-containing protein [Streptomyces sp. NPDC101455]|uniref:DUF6011 domain-containing protein n=1 Tax=Streptomyces sp. NPDC101455 TaxID=3366142 RepID=UPI00381D8232